jgi:hypothetical protein
MLISTFELLIKNILPPIPPSPGAPRGRIVIQGYFLSIANTQNTDITLTLSFHAKTPPFDLRPDPSPGVGIGDTRLLAFYDNGIPDPATGSTNIILPLPATNSEEKLIFDDLLITANDTALFILQPNVTKSSLINAADIEIRGYSEVTLKSAGEADVLISPEHRGTFLPTGAITSRTGDFDQLVYSLPTSTGSSLFSL